MKRKITIIKLGYIDHLVNIKKLLKWKSDIFEITDIQEKECLHDCETTDGYLDYNFTRDSIKNEIICPEKSDYAIALTQYSFDGNFFMFRTEKKCVGISLYGIPEILQIENIPIENFIIKQIYEICALSFIYTEISDDNVDIFHKETRRCIFDLNGERTHILYNTEQPEICINCKAKFQEKQIPQGIISIFDKELKKIKKPLINNIERSIKKYPLFSMILSAIIGMILNFLLKWLIKFILCEF